MTEGEEGKAQQPVVGDEMAACMIGDHGPIAERLALELFEARQEVHRLRRALGVSESQRRAKMSDPILQPMEHKARHLAQLISDDGGFMTYISNADRETMLEAMEEFIAKHREVDSDEC